MADRFAAGSALRVREVLHGSEWASWDEHVLADDAILVSVKPDGTPMAFPDHPVPHPWGHLDAWTGTNACLSGPQCVLFILDLNDRHWPLRSTRSGSGKPARAQPAPDGLIEVRQKLTAQQDKVN